MKTKKEFTDEEIELILRPANAEQLKILTKQELIQLLLCEQRLRKSMEDLVEKQKEKNISLEQASLGLKKKLFGRSSEKSQYIIEVLDGPPSEEETSSNNSEKPDDDKKEPKDRPESKNKTKRILSPSTRYPDAEINDIYLDNKDLSCPCCKSEMIKTSMEDITEKITFIQQQ